MLSEKWTSGLDPLPGETGRVLRIVGWLDGSLSCLGDMYGVQFGILELPSLFGAFKLCF